MLRRPKLFSLLALSVFLVGCSSAPKLSTSERQLGDAKNNLKSSDFKAALDNLSGAVKNANTDAVRQEAILLRVALVTALADANQQMAEAYHVGAKQPLARSQSGSFYKERSDYNNAARAYLMEAMQTVMEQRSKLGTTPVTVQVAFPGFTGGDDPAIAKIRNGQFVSDNERMNAELQLDRNCLAEILAGFVGDEKNPNKGQEIYNAGKVDVDPRFYLVVLSDDFLRIGNMFDTKGVNDPDKLRTVNVVVRDNLDIATKLLATKPDKDLETRVKKMQGDCDKCLKRLGA